MKKILLSTIITTIALAGNAFAHDCNLVVGENFKGTIKNYEVFTYKKVVPEAAFEQALTNLKAYCCAQVVPSSCSQIEKNSLPKSYPESAYLFDHLLDVTMRRLDGIPSLAYGLSVDPAGKAWRTYSNDVAGSANGTQAKTIEEKYQEYRTLHKKETKNLDIVAANFANDNSATLSLGDKYYTVCRLLKNIYEEIQSNPTIIGGAFESNSFLSKCQNLVTYRVNRETSYVKLLMIKKSTQLLDETTKAYTKKYFVEEKLMGLRNLVAKVKDMFKVIVQQAAVSKTCSK